MKKPVKIIFLILLVLAGAAYAAYSYLQPLELSSQMAVLGDMRYRFKEEGVISASVTQYLSAQSTGEVSQILCKEGQKVSAGEVLVKLTVSDLESQLTQLKYNRSSTTAIGAEDRRAKELQLIELQQQLHSVKMEKETSFSDWDSATSYSYAIEKAVRDLKEAHYQYEKAHDADIDGDELQSYLFKINDANNALEIARRSYNDNYQAYMDTLIQSISAQVTLLESQLSFGAMSPQYTAAVGEINENIARVTKLINNAVIKAPIDGIISALPVTRGQVVQPGSTLATVVAVDTPEVTVYLLAENSVYIKPGDSVQLTVSSSGKSGTGKISMVSPAAIEVVSSIGLSERRVKVTITPDSLPQGYGLGFSIDTVFEPLAESNVLFVPASSLIPVKDGYGVYVVEGPKALLKYVTIGTRAGNNVQITAGIEPGAKVVTEPRTDGLADGVRAIVKN